MKILVSDVNQTHADANKAKVEAECPTATVTTRIETLAASVIFAIANGYAIISRSTTGLSDSRNENEGDTAWTGGEVNSAFSSAFSSAFGGGSIQVGIVHSLGSNSHVRDTDPSRLDIISAISAGDGSGNCDASYGPGLEFFHDDESTQSYSTARIAGIIGQLIVDHPSWSFHDARQALRQTASNYASGWLEDGGYGYVDKTAATAVGSLDLSSSIRKDYTSVDGEVDFSWVSNPQSDFHNTIIAMFDSEPNRNDTPSAVQIIYEGVLEVFSFSHALIGARWFVFYTRDSSLDHSLVEDNVESGYWFDKVEIDLEYTPVNVSCILTENNVDCVLTDNNIICTLTEE